MPWAGHLYIGEMVSSEEEAKQIYNKLSIKIDKRDGVFGGAGKEFFVNYKNKKSLFMFMECENMRVERTIMLLRFH